MRPASGVMRGGHGPPFGTELGILGDRIKGAPNVGAHGERSGAVARAGW